MYIRERVVECRYDGAFNIRGANALAARSASRTREFSWSEERAAFREAESRSAVQEAVVVRRVNHRYNAHREQDFLSGINKIENILACKS